MGIGTLGARMGTPAPGIPLFLFGAAASAIGRVADYVARGTTGNPTHEMAVTTGPQLVVEGHDETRQRRSEKEIGVLERCSRNEATGLWTLHDKASKEVTHGRARKENELGRDALPRADGNQVTLCSNDNTGRGRRK